MRHPVQKIAFFGSSLVSSYWNGAATYYRGLIRALDALGYRTTFYEPNAYGRQQHRDLEDPSWAKVVVYAASEEGVASALEAARGADVIVKASGVGVFDELLEREVLNLRSPANCVVFWDVDAPATLERVQQDAQDPFRALIPRYDLIFTYGGGEPVISAYKALGARECIPVYNALDPATHFRTESDPAFAVALGFLGNRLPDREARVHQFFFKPARSLPGARFALGGSGWDDVMPAPPNVTRLGHVSTARHNAFNSSARMVLNVNRSSMARFGYSPATRVFEAAGAGACMITDAWEGIDHFLEPRREILVAESGEEVALYVASVNERLARAIGDAALRRVLAQHTYAHRARQVDGVFNGRSHPTVPSVTQKRTDEGRTSCPTR